jgi:hypothetical protein
MKLTSPQLIVELSKNINLDLAKIAVESYIEMQQRFLAGDWKPSELNGGILCEAISRCLYQLDTGRVAKKSVNEVREYLLDTKKNIPLSTPNPHKLPLKDRKHISKAIEIAYKFRSDRGVAHISTEHIANMMDSMLITHIGKWIFAEFLRIVWQKDIKVIDETIAQLVQVEHSLIHEYDGIPLVLDTSVTAQEEILLLLNHAPTNSLTRNAIQEQAPLRSPQAINGAIKTLVERKQLRVIAINEFFITPTGSKRVFEDIIPKLNK